MKSLYRIVLLLLIPLLGAAHELPFADKPQESNRWLDGYAIRYLVRLQESEQQIEERQSVQVALPTGGWLKDDASDLRVVTDDHYAVPVVVLSHDPRGDTLIQFTRRGNGRWYWVYAINPKAEPHIDAKQQAAIDRAHKAMQQETLQAMELRAAAAEAAATLRNARAEIKRQVTTAEKAGQEHDKLVEWVAARQEELTRLKQSLPPLLKRLADAKEVEVDAVAKAETAKAETAAIEDEAAKAAAEKATQPLRMAAAGARTRREAAEKELAAARQKEQQAAERLKEGQKQQGDAAKLQLESKLAATRLEAESGKLQKEAEAASQRASASVEKSAQLRQAWHALALKADPRLHQEGLSMEVRDWGGDQLDELFDWPSVVAGLQRSDNILGNALINDLLQKMNPFRLGHNLNFAASYRGYLDIRESGVYRFLLNADDAAFLFINDYLVHSRTGSNAPYNQRLGIFEVGDDIELDAGVYPFEVHQVTGNTPGAVGRCAFYWMVPDAKTWSRVPASAFRPALAGVVVRAEAPRKRQVALPLMGINASFALAGTDLVLATFMAEGAPAEARVAWNFGDGQQRSGRHVEHLYFATGDYEVAMESHPGLPPFRRRFHLWPAPVATSPLALDDAVAALRRADIDEFDLSRLALAYAFLRQCGVPERWPLIEQVTVRLLREPLQDLHYRVELMLSLMEALARQGRAADATVVGAAAEEITAAIRPLKIAVQMKLAEIRHRQMLDYSGAARLYEEIITKNRRYPLKIVRDAAIAWGDMYLNIGDLSRAATTYRLADGLGRQQGQLASVADASRRGGLIRTAEKLLRDGEIRQAQQLLQRIENDYPEQKVEGLFRFLCAESERASGLYNAAIRNYETLLRMPQWAGYHLQAVAGLADASYREEKYDEALKWLKLLEESDPDFYQKQKMPELRGLVNAAIFAGKTGAAAELRRERHLAFETAAVSREPEALLMAAPGVADGAALCFTTRNHQNGIILTFEIPHIEGGALYWLDFWYSNHFTTSHAIPIPAIEARWKGDNNSWRVNVIRTFGLEFMGGVLLRAPTQHQGELSLTFHNWHGLQRLHSLRLRPVSARQEAALLNFFEGRDTPE